MNLVLLLLTLPVLASGVGSETASRSRDIARAYERCAPRYEKSSADVPARREAHRRLLEKIRSCHPTPALMQALSANAKFSACVGLEADTQDCGLVAACAGQMTRWAGHLSSRGRKDDDSKKLADDALRAIMVFEGVTGRKVSFVDSQDHASQDFFRRTGLAQFNPNERQTAAIAESLSRHIRAHVKLTQAELLFEAVFGTGGNVTLAAGSLAKIFCDNRDLVHNIYWMDHQAKGKNYYRFAGLFIGLQESADIAALGVVGGSANILGNPIVYTFGKYFTKKDDPLRKEGDVLTFLSRAEYADKFKQYIQGYRAAGSIRPVYAHLAPAP
ncbi:MAG: hypothetical protein PHU21_11150 [Elusimicrobia bacterium]|nr:hypothetical protein [Elusimicrobiota bacterium]